MKKLILAVLCLGAIGMFESCTTTPVGSYQDSRAYLHAVHGNVLERSFQYEGPARNPVIVIHGLLGARLEDGATGENVWGNFTYGNMTVSGGKFPLLAHPMEYGKPLSSLENSVGPAGIMEISRIKVMGIEFKLDNYDLLTKRLSEFGYVPDNAPLPKEKHFYSQFIFSCDWRRDISENAARLDEFIRTKRIYLRRKYKELYGLDNYPVKFDIVGHSMGGLLARYYLRFGAAQLPADEKTVPKPTWAGAESVAKVIMIGTPNTGYADTFIELVNGLKLAPAAPAYPPELVGTFVSYYQMLPDLETGSIVEQGTGRRIDYLSPETWEKYGWGLADPHNDSMLAAILPKSLKTPGLRRRTALDHLQKCLAQARKFKKAMRTTVEHYPRGTSVWLIAGNAVETTRMISIDPKTGKPAVIERDSGDGKITVGSTAFDLRDGGDWKPHLVSPIRWSGIYYIQGGHMGIMNNAAFDSNLAYILLSAE